MEFLWCDWRFAGRALRKSPGFTALTVLTLALGIGAGSAIFSVVYGVLLRPFPYRAPGSLVIITAEQTFGGQTRGGSYSAMELEGWRERAGAFESLGMWGATSYRLGTAVNTKIVNAAFVSPQFFSTLDEPMLVGRPIGTADARLPVAVLSDRLWRREYGASPQVLDESIVLNEHPYAVVGVVRSDFQFPSENVDVWTPLGYAQVLGEEARVNSARSGGFHFVARLRPGATPTMAQVSAEEIARSIASESPRPGSGRRPIVVALTGWFTQTARPALLMLFAAVGLVVVVACANAMNLLLARQTSRSQEISIRRALGASSARLVSYSLAESGLLASAGGLGGVLLAAAGVRAFVSLWPASLPRADAIHVDGPVMMFSLALSMVTALVCAIGPAVRCLGYQLGAGLRQTGFTQSRRGRRARSVLVVTQLAACVVLLIGASLLGRSLIRLLRSDIGVTTDSVVVGELGFDLGRTSAPDQQIDAVDRVLARVSAIPGIRRASVATSLPLTGARLRYTLKDVSTGDGPVRDLDLEALATTPDFFSALGVRLVAGRFFTDADTATSQPVMIMSAHTARRVFGDRDPIGHVLTLPGPKGPRDVTLVGIVGDIKFNTLDAAADGGVYRPFRQQPWSFTYLLVQTSADPTAVAGALRRSVAYVDRRIAFDQIRTLDEALSRAAAEPRFRTVLLGSLAALALALASIGLYGAVAYSVSLRTTELGIRMALGATPQQVIGMVVGEGLMLAGVGAAIGVSSALALARVIQGLLFGVGPADVVSFAAAPAGLIVLAAVASYIPARRVASVDSISALRIE